MTGWKKNLLVVVGVLPAVLVLGIIGFYSRYLVAFDEESCPYAEVETRAVAAGVDVREDQRVCQEGVEEHRWVLLRAGRDLLELGRQPMPAEAYGDGYRWEAEVDEEGRARVDAHYPGLEGFRRFREPAPDSGLADY